MTRRAYYRCRFQTTSNVGADGPFFVARGTPGETLFVVYSRTQGGHGLVREDPIVGGTLVDGPAVNALAVKYSATIGE